MASKDQLLAVREIVAKFPDKKRAEFIKKYESLPTEKKEIVINRLLGENPQNKEPKRGRGDRSVIGNIFERPGAAIRNAVMNIGPTGKSPMQAYVEGANVPEEVPTFQQAGLDKLYSQQRPQWAEDNALGRYAYNRFQQSAGMGISAMGMLADMVTNPADVLMTLAGGLAAKPLGATKPGQSLTKFMTKSRSLKDVTRGATKFAKDMGKEAVNKIPKIMGDRWINQQAQNTQKVAKGLERVVGKAFRETRGAVKSVKVDPNMVDEILLNSEITTYNPMTGQAMDMTDDILRIVDKTFGGRVDTVEKAYALSDLLRKKAGSSVYKGAGTIGKGGLRNPQIRSKNTIYRIKELIHDSVNQVDEKAAGALRSLDKHAHDQIYPKIEKIYSIIGKSTEPRTEGIASVYRVSQGGLGKAGQRQTIRQTPKAIKGLKKYIADKENGKDLKELLSAAKQLGKDMKKYRNRQYIKMGVGAGAVLGGGKWGYTKMQTLTP